MIKQCPLCSKEFKGYNKYCSNECHLKGRGLARRKRVDVVCVYCRKEFWVHACRADNRRGRGTEAQFCSRDCKHAHWRLGYAPLTGKGQPYIDGDGYVLVSSPTHPEVLARKERGIRNNRIRQHRIVMEEFLGRTLLASETVHHKNGERACNTIDNLELWYKPQPSGQRVEDLIAYVVKYHTEAVDKALVEHQNLLNRREQS